MDIGNLIVKRSGFWRKPALCVSALLIGCIFIGFCGCQNSDDIKVAKVSGTITFCGKPLANAQVMFVPVPATAKNGLTNPISFGETDADGNYSLSLPGGAIGAVVGSHVVLVSKVEPLIGPVKEGQDESSGAADTEPEIATEEGAEEVAEEGDASDEGSSDKEPDTSSIQSKVDKLKVGKGEQRRLLMQAFLEATPFQHHRSRLGEQVPATFNTETELKFQVKKNVPNQADFEVGFDR